MSLSNRKDPRTVGLDEKERFVWHSSYVMGYRTGYQYDHVSLMESDPPKDTGSRTSRIVKDGYEWGFMEGYSDGHKE